MILTIKVAACGVEQYLDKCVSLFAKEKYVGMIEVIIVVNYCEDKSLAIALEYQKKYPKIFVVIEQGKMDYASTYNTSFSLMKGKYYVNLDGDDYFDEKNFDHYLDLLKNTDADIISTEYVMFNDKKSKSSCVRKHNLMPYKEYNFSCICDSMNFIEMHSLTVKTQLLRSEKVIVGKGTIGADLEYALKAQNRAKTIVFCDFVLYHYRQGHPSQRTSFEKLIASENENINRCLNLLLWLNGEKYQTAERKEYLEKRIASMCNVVFCIFLLEKYNKRTISKIKSFNQRICEIDSDLIYRYSFVSKILVQCPVISFPILACAYRIYKKNKKFIA